MNCLFVYGTLAPGGPNEHVLNAIGGTWQASTVNGYLKSGGWGAKMGYPGLVLDNTGGEVEGYLFCSEALENHWNELDEFEGEEYQRILTSVKTENNLELEAYVYILRDS